MRTAGRHLKTPRHSHAIRLPERGLKDTTCWFCRDLSACWCGKVGVVGGGSQLEGWTYRVAGVVTLRLCCAGKSRLWVVVFASFLSLLHRTPRMAAQSSSTVRRLQVVRVGGVNPRYITTLNGINSTPRRSTVMSSWRGCPAVVVRGMYAWWDSVQASVARLGRGEDGKRTGG